MFHYITPFIQFMIYNNYMHLLLYILWPSYSLLTIHYRIQMLIIHLLYLLFYSNANIYNDYHLIHIYNFLLILLHLMIFMINTFYLCCIPLNYIYFIIMRFHYFLSLRSLLISIRYRWYPLYKYLILSLLNHIFHH